MHSPFIKHCRHSERTRACSASANAADVFYSLGWNGQPLDPTIWAMAMLVVATILTLYVLRQRGDIAYSLVIVWAFVGIFVKQSATPVVGYTAIFGALVVSIFVLIDVWRSGQIKNLKS